MTLRAGRRERGVTTIETAIIGPLVILIMLAIFEFSLVFRDYLILGDAVSDAARVGAIVGPDVSPSGANGDYEIIRTLREAIGGIPAGSIERIVVFEALGSGADDPVAQVPAACKAGTATSRCNVYDSGAAFVAAQSADVDYFSCPDGPACFWPPSLRDDGPDPSTIDYLGVYVRVRHEYVTGAFGSAFTIERASVIRLEPGTVA